MAERSLRLMPILMLSLAWLTGCQAPQPTQPVRFEPTPLPEYQFRLVSPRAADNLRHRDPTLSARFGFASAHGQRYNGVNLQLQNNTPGILKVDWNKAKIIGIDGSPSPVTFTNAFVTKKSFFEEPMIPDLNLQPGESVTVTMYPVKNFRPAPSGNLIPASMLPRPSALNRDIMELGVFLTLKTEARQRYYTFRFEVHSGRG